MFYNLTLILTLDVSENLIVIAFATGLNAVLKSSSELDFSAAVTSP